LKLLVHACELALRPGAPETSPVFWPVDVQPHFQEALAFLLVSDIKVSLDLACCMSARFLAAIRTSLDSVIDTHQSLVVIVLLSC